MFFFFWKTSDWVLFFTPIGATQPITCEFYLMLSWVGPIFLILHIFFFHFTPWFCWSPFLSDSFWKSAWKEDILSSAYLNMSFFYAHLWMIIWEWTLFCFLILKVLLHCLLICNVISWEVNAILSPSYSFLCHRPKVFKLETYHIFSIPDVLLLVFFHLMCHPFDGSF